MKNSNEDKDRFDEVFKNAGRSSDPRKKKLERIFNEDRSNLINLRQDLTTAIAVEKQLEAQIRNRRRKQFEQAGEDPEIEKLEEQLNRHRQVKEELRTELAARESQLQSLYANKPGVFGFILAEPKNVFALIVFLVIITALSKIFQN